MPKVESRLRYVEHIEAKGRQFYRLACERDLEGVFAKWRFGTYSTDPNRTLLAEEQKSELLAGGWQSGVVREAEQRRKTPSVAFVKS